MNSTIARRIAFVEQFEVLVGIDLGKHKNVAVRMTRQGQIVGKREFGHSRQGYAGLVGWGQRGAKGASAVPMLLGFEPTNDYWRWLANYLNEQGQAYRLVNPFAVKKQREASQLDYAKDDLRDAVTISYLLRNGQFTETQLLQGAAAEMRSYATGHWRLNRTIGRTKTVLRQTVELLFPELSDVFEDFEGQTVQALLHAHAAPATMTALPWAELEQAVRQDFHGQRLAVSKLRHLYQRAPTSIGLPQAGALQLLIEQHLSHLELLQQQVDQVEKGLLAQFHTLPSAPALLSLGLGEVTTALVVAEIGDLTHFHKAAQLVKLAGIQPTPKQSGDYERQQTPMSHKGRPRLRTYLFWACLRLVQTDPAFAAAHQRLCLRLNKMQAIGALMNQLVHVLWALHRTQAPYVAAVSAQEP
jgi:transposase